MTKSPQSKSNQWDSSFAFLMAMIGSAVGLGNIWRFSHVVYTNGGGAFFIPYIIAILILGIPFLIMEYGLGYHFKDSLSNILKKIKPKFEVFGWFIMFIVFMVLLYYMIIIGWDFIYLILSFFKGWGMDPAVYFANNIIVGGDNLNNILEFVLPVSLITILLWVVVWFISHKDLNEGLSRVVKVLVPMLFIIMAIIVVYALTLPGQMIGLSELFTPNWSSLTNIDIWLAAFGQVVFSLSVGQAVAVTYASYLPEKSKLIDKVFIVAGANAGFEVFTAIGVFSILGFMSLNSGIPVSNIATSGSGLLFIVFPEIFNTMGIMSYIIGPLFFLCVLFAGITSALSLLEPISNGITQKFGYSRKKTLTLLCAIGLIASLIFTTGSGNYLLTIADEFLNEFGILLSVILQTIIISWYYGLRKLIPELNYKAKLKVGSKWIFILKIVLPIVLIFMWIMGIINLIATETGLTLMVELIITAIIIIVPVILTKLPSKTSENNQVDM
ncbi:sodium-dependent transporter [Methanosphaera cuniculi]|uniref:Sodium:calcium symporter n=1 Tax=Methanosphaera cuniculi TaxID=1077256 RepID=A0A2A2HBE8_9EURY|nr:sodium-dependent transporter [Methanosphaera cuniculi]PAV06685.1 sodium:calcium symporter [Methanosphaera cuniculi]PWL08796.1 sodium:neurotransmitter symporter family protein [Methanosphaera cuniculi]